MQQFFTKRVVTSVVISAIIAGLFIFFIVSNSPSKKTPPNIIQVATSTPQHKIIGKSVEGRSIDSYTYLPSGVTSGDGKTNLLFVGGMHGGYEWNSVLLAYKFMDYLKANPNVIPAGLSITVIPSLNPDGVYKVVGKEGRFTVADVTEDKTILASGRFNEHSIDLNRNFDCKWKPTSTWQAKIVSAGKAPFSEPETQAIRDFVLDNKPSTVVFWHSQANAVYASECENGILPDTLDIMNAYSHATGYPPVKSFDAYPVTGDSEGWLASIGIPAITVELKTHDTIEWDKNLLGIKALFKYYGNK